MATNDIEAVKRLFARIAKARLTQADFHSYASIAREERANGFERGEGPDGEAWKPLKPATIRRKSGIHATSKMKRKGGISGLGGARTKAAANPSAPLIDTGVLMKPTISATSKEGKVTLPKSRSETVSSAGSISMIHDKGSGNIPRRRHWGIYAKARERITKEFEKRMKALWREVMHGA